jgi:signal transduction histidine kinase
MNRPRNERDGGRPDAVGLEDASAESLLRQLDLMQREIDALRREAGEASELAMLGLLSACTAHELRNVLTPVLSYAQLARRKPEDRALVEKGLDRIASGLQAAVTILGGTLQYASSRGDLPARHDTDIDAALRDVVEMLPRHPSEDGINLAIDVEPGLRARIEPVALRQVVLNLLLNAIDAIKSSASPGPHCVTVRGRRGAGPTGIVIDVSDTGPGVPPELAGRMFEPLVSGRPKSAQCNERGRAGLGLAICRRLVETAGGTIAYDANALKGASFRISLPAAEVPLRKAG